MALLQIIWTGNILIFVLRDVIGKRIIIFTFLFPNTETAHVVEIFYRRRHGCFLPECLDTKVADALAMQGAMVLQAMLFTLVWQKCLPMK